MSHSRRHALFFQWAALSAAAVAIVSMMDVMRRCNASLAGDPDALLNVEPPRAIMLGGRSLDGAFAKLFARPETGIQAPPDTGGIATRYRLVGALANVEAPDRATAFIEELASGRQRRYRIGDALETDSVIRSIMPDEVWVSTPSGEVCLARAGKSADRDSQPDEGRTAAAGASGGADRFGGTQTGANSWTFNRQAVLNYYQELLDRPERLVKVFDSLAPIYNDQRKIEGYRVKIEGERDFFNAVGLRQGDVVRRVNGIEMTNRYRAENLIRRYAQNDLDLVVIELERDGQPVKQVYHAQ